MSDEQILQFQNLYKKHFGSEISPKDAHEKGAKLIRLLELIYKPLNEGEYLKLQARRQATGNSQPKT